MAANASSYDSSCVRGAFESKDCCRGAENNSRSRREEGKKLTDSRDSSNDLTKLELVKNGGLSCCVESDHQDSHFLLSEETRDCSSGSMGAYRL